MTLRWLMAALAIVICCTGNEYPAKSQSYLNTTSALDRYLESAWDRVERKKKEQRIRDIVREEIESNRVLFDYN